MTSLGRRGFPPLISPTRRLGRARTRASFCLRGRAVLVACNSLTSLGAWGPGLPPIHRLGRARALPVANTIFNSNYNFKPKCQIQIQLQCHLIFKFKCQFRISNADWQVDVFRIIYVNGIIFQNVFSFKHLILKFIYSNGILLIGIMFSYTTSDVYLTIRLKF